MRYIVTTCGECPFCSEHDHGTIESRCTMLDEKRVRGGWPPLRDCPLRRGAILVEIHREMSALFGD